MNNINLYIGNKKVDIDDNLNLSFNYTLEDFDKPSNIKNYYTKQITIKGTKNNNAIFGEIYNFDREQLFSDNNIIGAYFNPSKRTDFKIFKNSELIESGYMQLQSITIDNKVIQYNIVLYGGVGDFFYNLMYDKDSGEKIALSDLRFFVEDEDGKVLPSDNEFDFTITKEFVEKCFKTVNQKGNQINNFITFSPMYNGLYEDFDLDSILINTNNSHIFTQKSITEGGETYTTFNGYAVGKLNKKYTEWELKDLRSYMQRPSIKLSKLIETICRPINNGGYTVELDNTFFNESNPYYSKAFIALPLFNSQNDSDDDVAEEDVKVKSQDKENWIGDKTKPATLSTKYKDNTYLMNIDSTATDIIMPEELPFRSLVDLTIPISISFNPTYSPNLPLPDTVYTSYKYDRGEYVQKFITAQIKVYDAEDPDVVIAKSNAYYFQNILEGKNPYLPILFENDGTQIVNGTFKKRSDSDIYDFTSIDEKNTFNVKIENVLFKKKYKIEVEFRLWRDTTIDQTYPNEFYFSNNADLFHNKTVSGYENIDVDNENIKLNVHWASGSILSNFKIDKKRLLKTENSPADYLLDYCKMFGLYFEKDLNEKIIKIKTRNNFFKNKINNIQNKIDYSQEIEIQPIIFNKKFYRMALSTPETYFAKKYKNEYSVDYGQQRMATQYQFNNDTEDLFDDSIYENIITAEDKSTFYRTFYDKDGNVAPCFLLDNIDYELFQNVGTENEKSKSIEISGANKIDLLKTQLWNAKAGYDCFPKICCFSQKNDEKTTEDLSSCLMFYLGDIIPTDVAGNKIKYYLTDDVSEMNLVSDDEATAIYTENEYTENGQRIAIFLDKLPQFGRYIFNDANEVQYSLDFGLPKQFFINNINYIEDKTIYYKFHRKFYGDQFSVNTKKVTAYVVFDDIQVNNECLKEFYYFNNSIWIINKINNFNPLSNNAVQVEFIKVQDINNYINGQNIY